MKARLARAATNQVLQAPTDSLPAPIRTLGAEFVCAKKIGSFKILSAGQWCHAISHDVKDYPTPHTFAAWHLFLFISFVSTSVLHNNHGLRSVQEQGIRVGRPPCRAGESSLKNEKFRPRLQYHSRASGPSIQQHELQAIPRSSSGDVPSAGGYRQAGQAVHGSG
jgi:hypothetical protein